MWRNMMENSYNSSLTEKEKLDSDKESDFKKSFKEVFSRQFRESFSQYIKDKESELGVLEDHKEMLVEEVVEDFKEVRGEKRSAEEDIEESPSKRARGKGEASEAFVVESSSPLPSGRREISASPQRPPMNSPSRVPLRPPGSQEGLPTGVRLSSARLIDGIQSPRSAGNTI